MTQEQELAVALGLINAASTAIEQAEARIARVNWGANVLFPGESLDECGTLALNTRRDLLRVTLLLQAVLKAAK